MGVSTERAALLLNVLMEASHGVYMTLNIRNKILDRHMVSLGTANQSIVHPRDVFRVAIIDGASRICMIHNHPGGNLEPSRDDYQITDRIQKAGELLGIPLLDHIIIAREGHYSFKESGLLSE